MCRILRVTVLVGHIVARFHRKQSWYCNTVDKIKRLLLRLKKETSIPAFRSHVTQPVLSQRLKMLRPYMYE